ncbi:MAG: cell division protein FtsH, partial [Phycisphaerae bacterium]|nr:cell division protein FtsH [Phycisphaerae bacterium]
EEMFCGDIDSGAAADIAQATELARKMILEWGMSEKLSFVRYTSGPQNQMMFDIGGKDYSEKTAEIIDEEIKVILNAAYKDAGEMLQTNRDKVKGIADALLNYETLDAEDVKRIIAGETLDKPSINGLLETEAAKTTTTEPPRPPQTDQTPDVGTIPEPG